MVQITMNGKTYELASTIRVVYALKDINKSKTLQDALRSIGQLGLDGQIELMYAAYKAGKPADPVLSKEEFIDMVLDTQGVYAVAETVRKLTDELMYSGMTPEEAAAKKMEVEKQVLEAQAQQAGATSSAKDSD